MKNVLKDCLKYINEMGLLICKHSHDKAIGHSASKCKQRLAQFFVKPPLWTGWSSLLTKWVVNVGLAVKLGKNDLKNFNLLVELNLTLLVKYCKQMTIV